MKSWLRTSSWVQFMFFFGVLVVVGYVGCQKGARLNGLVNNALRNAGVTKVIFQDEMIGERAKAVCDGEASLADKYVGADSSGKYVMVTVCSREFNAFKMGGHYAEPYRVILE